jgi:putative transposase
VFMSILKAYRYQLRLKQAQQAQLVRWSGGLRWVWNKALGEQKARHERGDKYASYVDMAKWLTAWRCAPETLWLAQGPVHPQQQVLKRLDEAYKRFFKKTGGLPKFKARGFELGLRYPDPKQITLDDVNQRIQLPKLGWVRLRLSRDIEGVVRNVTVSREGARWYASIQTKGNEALAAGLAPSLGIDLGVAAFAATSDGVLVDPLGALKRQQCRLRRYQRSVSRKVKGSSNRKKAVRRLGELHRRIARQRSDWLHQLSTRLVTEHPVIAIEELKVKSMTGSAKGTASQPGTNVRQKAGLNKGILDQAWAEFKRQLQYKSAAVGGEVLAINPAYTSQTCNVCDHVHAHNRKTQSLFLCVACGHTENADINAAKNILKRGQAAWQDRKNQTAAGHAASVHGEIVRQVKVAKPKAAVSAKWKPAEEVVP